MRSVSISDAMPEAETSNGWVHSETMRNIMALALLVFSGVSAAMPEESLRELQSAELRRVYTENSSGDLRQLTGSEEAREHMLQQALFYAGRGKPVDNRAYLFALAVDLYHSLPPGPDPSGYEPGELGGKGEWMRWFQNWLGADQRDIEQDRDTEWETLLRAHAGQPDHLVASIEIKYIRHYFQEHIQLDDFIEHARLDAEDLSFSNPTHYSALRAYVDSMQHRIRSGVPPWEDPTESPGSDEAEGGSEAAPGATGSPVPTAKTAEPAAPFATPPPEKTYVMPSLVKLAIGVLIGAIVVFAIRHGRN